MLVNSITSRANSSSIPARPSAAAISSPIWSTRPSLWTQPGRRAGRASGQVRQHRTLARPLAARAHRLTVELAPTMKSSRSGADLKAHQLTHQTFTDLAALDQAVYDAVIDLNRERIPDPLAMPRIFYLGSHFFDWPKPVHLLWPRPSRGRVVRYGSVQLGFLLAIVNPHQIRDFPMGFSA